MDEDPETVQHPQSGMPGSLRIIASRLQGFLGRVSPGLALIFTMS